MSAAASSVPLFPGIPGGAELLVLLLVFLLLLAPLAVVVGLVVAGVSILGGGDGAGEGVAETDRA